MMFHMSGNEAGKRNRFLLIAKALRQRIESGELPSGRYLPTERELQEEFAVSRSTVRRALQTLIQDGWGENIPSRGVIASGGPITSPRSQNIALIDNQTYVLRVLHVRMSEMLRQQGFHLVHLGGTPSSSVEELIKYANDKEFAGALVWSFRGFPDSDEITDLSRSLPIVAMDHRLNNVATDLISFDYFDAAYRATSHLIQQGRRNIGVAGMYDMLEINHQKLSGYMKAMFDHGCQPESTNFLFTLTSGMAKSDTRHVEWKLRQPDRPDAFLMLQDDMTPHVIEAVLAAGLSVPGDVALAAVGDDTDIQVDGIGLTTVALDWEAMATLAIDQLLSRIKGSTGLPKTRFAPHRLIVRGLCGANQENWSTHPEELTGFHGELPYPRSQYRFDTSRVIRQPESSPTSQSRGKNQ